MTLYRKYRSQTVEELDLEIVRQQLKKFASSQEKIPHAFLFAGPKGTGKTSAARILAKIINCENPKITKDGIEPCNKCRQCVAITNGQSMDVIEMDAASNRGIDDIRSLRESISLTPATAKRKVYIMDEAHMLTTEAANAFLKTLEEPPEHAVFILATTDPQKLPSTVRSRLSTVTFQKATKEEIARSLKRIADGEKLKIDDDAVALIAKKADGSFRDAVKIIENLAIDNKKITKDLVEKFVFNSNLLDVEDFASLIIGKKAKELLDQIKSFTSSGGNISDLIDELMAYFRTELLASASGGDKNKIDDFIGVTKLLMDAKFNLGRSAIPELPLELAIIEWCGQGEVPKKVQALPTQERKVDEGSKKKDEIKPDVVETSEKRDSGGDIDDEVWAKILGQVRAKNISLEAVLRTAKPLGMDGETLNLAVYYRFHKERLETDQYKRMLEDIVCEVTGSTRAKLVCTLEEPPKELKKEVFKPSLTEASSPDIIKAATEIFGG